MDAPQLVLVVVGLVLVAGGTAGMMLGGDGTPQLYAVTFTTATEDLPLASASWASPGADVAFTVTRQNLTAVEVTVSCTDPNPLGVANPATVAVTVSGPGGASGSGSGQCGSPVVVDVDVAPVPAATTGRGTSPEDAIRNIPAATNGTGDWTVAIEESRVQDLPAGGAPSGEVSVRVTSYTAQAAITVVR